MLGTPYQTKLTFLANLLTFLLILLQWKLGYDMSAASSSIVVALSDERRSRQLPACIVPAASCGSAGKKKNPTRQSWST